MNLARMDPRYPLGPYVPPATVAPEARAGYIADLAALPAALRDAVDGRPEADLARRYRPGGWTVRQVIHHVADSHTNALVRFKWALTEDTPTIKAYREGAWAELPDVEAVPVAVSLALLEALHARWTGLLRALPDDAWARDLVHPQRGRMRLDDMLPHYAWHGRHHLAHVALALEGA